MPFERAPVLFGRLGQFEDHRQKAGAGHTPASLAGAQPHRGKGRFNRVGGPDVQRNRVVDRKLSF